jgi:hypothetical protein
MLRFHFVDDVQTSLAANNLVIWTDFFDTCTHFHADHLLPESDSLLNLIMVTSTSEILGFAIGDSALRKIVGGQLNRHAVAGYDADKMLPHFTSDMSYDLMAVLEFYTKLSPW